MKPDPENLADVADAVLEGYALDWQELESTAAPEARGVLLQFRIIAAIAVPGLLRARISGNEASAIGSLRAVSSAQSTFAASCANGMYAQSLQTLGSGPSGGSAFISPDLGASATVTKSGYTVSMTGMSSGGRK